MTYAVGQEVVYVGPDGRFHVAAFQLLHGISLNVPVRGVVYHIREVQRRADREYPGYFLREIVNQPRETEFGFREPLLIPHYWLKPVEKRKTDITEIEKLLDVKNHKKLVGA